MPFLTMISRQITCNSSDNVTPCLKRKRARVSPWTKDPRGPNSWVTEMEEHDADRAYGHAYVQGRRERCACSAPQIATGHFEEPLAPQSLAY